MDERQWQTRVSEPEILPPGEMPDYGYQQPTAPPPPRPRRSGWQLAPATYVLTGINIAVYLVMVLSGVSPTSPSGEHLIHWGANVGVLVLADHEWWRLVTSTFVHSGIIHIAILDFLRQLTTFRAEGGTLTDRLNALNKFGGLFLGKIWDIYGPVVVPHIPS